MPVCIGEGGQLPQNSCSGTLVCVQLPDELTKNTGAYGC